MYNKTICIVNELDIDRFEGCDAGYQGLTGAVPHRAGQRGGLTCPRRLTPLKWRQRLSQRVVTGHRADLTRGRVSDQVRDVVTKGVRTLVTFRHDDNLRGTGGARRRLTARAEVGVREGGPEITLLVIVILILKL